jgi:hypothetical protein
MCKMPDRASGLPHSPPNWRLLNPSCIWYFERCLHSCPSLPRRYRYWGNISGGFCHIPRGGIPVALAPGPMGPKNIEPHTTEPQSLPIHTHTHYLFSQITYVGPQPRWQLRWTFNAQSIDICCEWIPCLLAFFALKSSTWYELEINFLRIMQKLIMMHKYTMGVGCRVC